jgi:hypothetical protein
MIRSTPDKVEQFVGGKKLLIAFGGSVLAAAVVGTVGYFVFHALLGNAWGTTVSQIVTLQVYMMLLITLCVRFRPVTEPPVALRPSGAQHAIASVGIWIATVAAIVLFYFCLGSIFGSVSQVAKQITAFATDAKRLQGQPTPAWIIAIFCCGTYSASLGRSVRFSCALKCSTFTRPPYESDGQEQRESSPSHSPPNIYKSEGPESRLPNCPHSGHVRIPRTMDNA